MNPIVALLLARYRLLPDDRGPCWYDVEGARIRRLARAVGQDEGRVLLATAILSPATRWEYLLARLPAFLVDPLTPMPTYGRNRRLARAALEGASVPTGPKVSRFARNLSGDHSCVTIDRWAARAAGYPESGRVRWYRALESAYQGAAERAGRSPAHFQAILWLAIRSGHLPRLKRA